MTKAIGFVESNFRYGDGFIAVGASLVLFFHISLFSQEVGERRPNIHMSKSTQETAGKRKNSETGSNSQSKDALGFSMVKATP